MSSPPEESDTRSPTRPATPSAPETPVAARPRTACRQGQPRGHLPPPGTTFDVRRHTGENRDVTVTSPLRRRPSTSDPEVSKVPDPELKETQQSYVSDTDPDLEAFEPDPGLPETRQPNIDPEAKIDIDLAARDRPPSCLSFANLRHVSTFSATEPPASFTTVNATTSPTASSDIHSMLFNIIDPASKYNTDTTRRSGSNVDKQVITVGASHAPRPPPEPPPEFPSAVAYYANGDLELHRTIPPAKPLTRLPSHGRFRRRSSNCFAVHFYDIKFPTSPRRFSTSLVHHVVSFADDLFPSTVTADQGGILSQDPQCQFPDSTRLNFSHRLGYDLSTSVGDVPSNQIYSYTGPSNQIYSYTGPAPTINFKSPILLLQHDLVRHLD